MTADPRDQVTLLLLRMGSTPDPEQDWLQLWDLVHDELRTIARRLMRSENEGHTLQPTALVHEAYLKLIDQDRVNWQNRAQFYAIAARIMRRILVDHARRRSAHKRGGQWEKVTIDEQLHGEMKPLLDTIALERALEKLTVLDERMVRVIELRVFGGLTVKEVAHVLDLSKRTVEKDWAAALQWLTRELATEAA